MEVGALLDLFKSNYKVLVHLYEMPGRTPKPPEASETNVFLLRKL